MPHTLRHARHPRLLALLPLVLSGLALSSCGVRSVLRSTDGYRVSPIVELAETDQEQGTPTLCSLADGHLPEGWSARRSNWSSTYGPVNTIFSPSWEWGSTRAETAVWFALECKADGPEEGISAHLLQNLLDGLETELAYALSEADFRVHSERSASTIELTYDRPSGIEGLVRIRIEPVRMPPRATATATPGSSLVDAAEDPTPTVDRQRSPIWPTPEPSLRFHVEVHEGTWDYVGADEPAATPAVRDPAAFTAVPTSTATLTPTPSPTVDPNAPPTMSIPPDLALTATALYEGLQNTPVPFEYRP